MGDPGREWTVGFLADRPHAAATERQRTMQKSLCLHGDTDRLSARTWISEEIAMKKTIAAACALALLSSVLYAGGPVVVETEEVVVAEAPASSTGALVPLLLLAVIAALIASGDSDDEAPRGCVAPG
jgi:hypothetical protein